MSMTDPIADLLTRVRNGLRSQKVSWKSPSSALKVEIAENPQGGGLHPQLQDDGGRQAGPSARGPQVQRRRTPTIEGLRRASRPGRRVYLGKDDIKPVLGGLGVAILSTPRGLLTDKTARREGVGGELLCRSGKEAAMSRIGKQPIPVPSAVKVSVKETGSSR